MDLKKLLRRLRSLLHLQLPNRKDFFDRCSQVTGMHWIGFRRALGINLYISLVGLLALTLWVWYIDLIEDLLAKILLNAIFLAVPLSMFFRTREATVERQRFDRILLGFVVFLWLALAIGTSGRLGWTTLETNLVLTTVALPYLVFNWLVFRSMPLIGLALVPSLGLIMVYLLVDIPPAERWGYARIPALSVVVIAAAWASVAWVSLKCTIKQRAKIVWGAAAETAAMIVLFMPLIMLAVDLPRLLNAGEALERLSAVGVSILFGGVVSEPLRRFIREVGKLAP